MGSHGSWSLLFMMSVMVSHFGSNSHSPLTSLIDMLPSNHCRADFSDMWACVIGELCSLRKNVTLYGFMMGI
jgi:hypothetical protein